MTQKPSLEDAGWNANVPPNGFFNRPEATASNDNADGLSSESAKIEIETTPEHMNLVSGDPAAPNGHAHMMIPEFQGFVNI